MTDSKDTSTQALPTPGAGPRMLHVPLTAIAPSLTNPRKHFDQAKLQELADSIKASGVHQPILLRPLPVHRLEDTLITARTQKQPAPEYELVAGERRWRASHLAGLTEIPALIRPMTDAQALEAQVIENLQREDVTELEEAEGYQILMQTVGINADEVAQRIGKSRSYVFGRLKILELCEHGRQLLREGKLDFSCALPIARIPNEQLQLKALKEAAATDFQGDRMSAREVQGMVRSEFMTKLDYANFDREDASLCPSAGACTSCPHRTGNNPDMFAVVDSADVCTNPPCYHAKEEAHKAQVRERAVASGCEIITGREAKTLIPNSFTSSIEGHVRLDVATDSPIKGKPLRAVVGNVMEQAGIKPTLIENPHTKELVAVVRKEQAAELLKMVGNADAETKLREEAKANDEAKALQDAEAAAEKYEREWRQALATAVIKAMEDGSITGAGDMLTETAVALHVLKMINKDEATRLAAILNLGKVAPHNALQDHASTHNFPITVAASALVLRDASYEPLYWKYNPDAPRNALLLDMAKHCSVDVEAIKAQVQGNIRAATEAAKAAVCPVKPVAPKSDLPLTPAARTTKDGGQGKAKGKTQRDPAALAGGGGKKLSAEAAAAGIAAALQAAAGEPEPGAAVAAQGNDAGPVAAAAAQAPGPLVTLKRSKPAKPAADTPAAGGTGESADDGQDGADVKTGAAVAKPLTPETRAEAIGKGVRVLPTVSKSLRTWIGEEGKAVALMGDRAVLVEFPAAPRCKPLTKSFDASELELVQNLEAA